MEIFFAILLALIVTAVFILPTYFSWKFTRGKDPQFIMTITLGVWLIKIILLLALLLLLKDAPFCNHIVFACTVVPLVMIATGLEVWRFTRELNADEQ